MATWREGSFVSWLDTMRRPLPSFICVWGNTVNIITAQIGFRKPNFIGPTIGQGFTYGFPIELHPDKYQLSSVYFGHSPCIVHGMIRFFALLFGALGLSDIFISLPLHSTFASSEAHMVVLFIQLLILVTVVFYIFLIKFSFFKEFEITGPWKAE